VGSKKENEGSTQSSQRAAENHGEESVRDEAREVAWFIEGLLYL
jgi:hypothetical protein